jgi:hypothetical protein
MKQVDALSLYFAIVRMLPSDEAKIGDGSGAG